jgi:hypothetical protein
VSIAFAFVTLAMIAISAVQASPQQPQAAREEAPRRLVVAYSDGRTTEQLLRPTGGFWTPTFPRRSDAPAHDGLELKALQVDFRVTTDVRVHVSLKYGTPHQKTIPVADAVIGAEPVRIAELEAYGVDPIVISVDAFSPASLVQPVVSSASPMLEASVELVKSDVPIYKFVLRNRSNRPVMAVQYLMFRDGKQIGSGRRKTNRQTPVIAPAGEHTWTSHLGAGTIRGFDRFEVSAVLWEDGTVEGDAQLKSTEEALAVGMAQQLRRVVGLLNDALPTDDVQGTPWSVGQLRAAVERLPIEVEANDPALADGPASRNGGSVKIGQQLLKEMVLQELSEFSATKQANDPVAARAWIAQARARYVAWWRRIASQ